ncbi:MAG: glycosyltransferase family 39 protein [Chloroflexota bacterium]|nr:glycosyltransferase family 39 protein [Chloroflexota bacterium]
MKKILPRPLVLLLAVFLALALFYSLILPLFEGPDEDDHFRYAKFIADTHAWPVQQFEPGGGAAGHQGWQPPLYYSLAALVIAPIDTSDYSQHLWRNSAATLVGDPACCGRNLYYHTDSENFPFTRTTLAVHLARLLSILFGAITVAATYAVARTVLAHSPISYSPLSLAAAAFVAFNPSFLFASALVSNDAALATLCSLVLLLWVRLLCGSTAPTLKSAALLGLLIALALLTKTTALGLVPLSMLVLTVVARRERRWRYAVAGNAVMLAVVAALSGWWFARNQILYGDPLALRLVEVASLFQRAGPLTLPEFFQISLPWMWQTFWGGPTPGDFAPILLVALAVFTMLAFVGVIVFITRHASRVTRHVLAFLAAWLAFILIAQIQFIRTTTGADQGRYLFPVISSLALFFVVGLYQVFASLASRFTSHASSPVRLSFVICSFVIVSFFALALYVPLAYTLPAYARPALASESDLARASHPLQIDFADQIELRGYDLDARVVKAGDALRITLYWRALTSMNESDRVFVHLIGANNRNAGGADVIPARGAFPTVYWKPGDALRDVVQIPVMANAVPGKYTIEVGLYPVGKPGERLTTTSGDDRALLESVKVAPREPVTYAPQTRVEADFGGTAKLIGYDLTNLAKAPQPSQGLGLTLYWQCLARMDSDYTVFVHALDADGKIIAQADHQPQDANYPTSLWDTGEQVRDDVTLALPASGKYRIEVGLYRADTGARLPVAGARGDSVLFDVAFP